MEDSLVDIIEQRIVEPILDYGSSPAAEFVENKVTTQTEENKNIDSSSKEAKIESERDEVLN